MGRIKLTREHIKLEEHLIAGEMTTAFFSSDSK